MVKRLMGMIESDESSLLAQQAEALRRGEDSSVIEAAASDDTGLLMGIARNLAVTLVPVEAGASFTSELKSQLVAMHRQRRLDQQRSLAKRKPLLIWPVLALFAVLTSIIGSLIAVWMIFNRRRRTPATAA